jgi:hypothetical protein
MKNRNLALTVAALAVAAAPAILTAQESESNMLSMTQIDLKPASWMKFGRAMSEYIDCYSENGGTDAWTTWRDVEKDSVWIVMSMNGWAGMDEGRSDANRACYTIIEEKMGPMIENVKTEYAERMDDWSGDYEDYDVVRLHQLVPGDMMEFRASMREMLTVVKEAEYEHLGIWYSMVGADADEVAYFNVEPFENFAAMDADRPGYYGVMAEAKGEEAAADMWENMTDTLADDGHGYDTVLLARAEDWSHDPEEG